MFQKVLNKVYEYKREIMVHIKSKYRKLKISMVPYFSDPTVKATNNILESKKKGYQD